MAAAGAAPGAGVGAGAGSGTQGTQRVPRTSRIIADHMSARQCSAIADAMIRSYASRVQERVMNQRLTATLKAKANKAREAKKRDSRQAAAVSEAAPTVAALVEAALAKRLGKLPGNARASGSTRGPRSGRSTRQGPRSRRTSKESQPRSRRLSRQGSAQKRGATGQDFKRVRFKDASGGPSPRGAGRQKASRGKRRGSRDNNKAGRR